MDTNPTLNVVLGCSNVSPVNTGTPGADGQVSLNRLQVESSIPASVQYSMYDTTTCTSSVPMVSDITGFHTRTCQKVTTTRHRNAVVPTEGTIIVYDPVAGNFMSMSPRDALGMLTPFSIRDAIEGDQYNFALGWWYGVYVADGWPSGDRICYCKNNDAKLTRFAEIAKKYLCEDLRICRQDAKKNEQKFSNSSKITLSGKDLRQHVFSVHDESYKNANGKRGALFKKLPNEILRNGSRDALIGLFSGLLDGDSTLGWNNHSCNGNRRFVLKFNSSSKSLIRDIKLLLRKFGIRYSVTSTRARSNSNESWTLCPSVVDFMKIAPELRCVGDDETVRINEYLERYSAKKIPDRLDIVPISESLAVALSVGMNELNPSIYTALRKARTLGHVGRVTALKVLDFVEMYPGKWQHEHLATLSGMATNHDIHWDRVASVADIGKRTFADLCLPPNQLIINQTGMVVSDFVVD